MRTPRSPPKGRRARAASRRSSAGRRRSSRSSSSCPSSTAAASRCARGRRRDRSAPVDVDKLPPGLLCLPTTAPRNLLVEIPFTASDVAALELTVGLWERTWPCYRPPLRPSRPHLVFGFNANISEPQHAAARARVEALMARPVLRECFGRVALESAYLSGSDDLYDKRRLDSNWTQGPNNLFYHFLDSAARGGYAYMAQLEADIVPLRENWLERMQCVASASRAWVVGSAFLSQCAHKFVGDAAQCTELGDEIKFHINGNALYAAGDGGFDAFWRHARTSEWRAWPFDLALHLYAQQLPAPTQRALLPKFVHDEFIVNYGAEPLADAVPALRERHADAYLLHSSWAMRQLRQRGAAGFRQIGLEPLPGFEAAADADAGDAAADGNADAGAGAPPPPPSAADEAASLLRAARARADGRGRLVVTFVTAAYDVLCDNFVRHLAALDLRAYLLVTFDRAQHDRLERRGEPVYLRLLPQLKSGGSDQFASRDFF